MLSICDMALLLVGVEGERRRAPGRELMIQQEEQAGWFLCTRQGQRCEQVGRGSRTCARGRVHEARSRSEGLEVRVCEEIRDAKGLNRDGIVSTKSIPSTLLAQALVCCRHLLCAHISQFLVISPLPARFVENQLL